QSPFDAYLLHLSLGTLPLRMERHSSNALAIAQFLEGHPSVEWVRYPGLSSHPQNDMAKVYLKDGCGGMIAFSVKGGIEAGKKFIEALDLIGHMANLGDSRTIVIHPASTTHSQLTRQQREAAGIGEGLIRLSVGLEDSDDIIADLSAALSSASV
ncbi:MAG: O-acetylhomoserine aminocarboxypropyltransferase/cysteine synthase, partial [Synergistaceae bacterium]|nr:O-acetylhomoserine aminocarboxypropyltransferase/cysteine synthase [Synergistaceae bacterium]